MGNTHGGMNLNVISGIYANEAKGATCLLLQQKVLAEQAVRVEKYISEAQEFKEKLQDIVADSQVGPLEETTNPLKSRMSNEEKKSKTGPDGRVLDDVEMTIMGILDSDGKISVKGRLSDFMSLMTRITKVDHRALCLHILQNCISEICQHTFIEEGGLRLLKQWIKVAQEQSCINELKSILKLLKKLPLHKDYVLSSGIDVMMKQLKKWNDGALSKQVESLKNAWSEAMKSNTSTDSTTLRANAGTPEPLSEAQVMMVSAIQTNLIASKPHVTPTAIPVAPDSAAEHAAVKEKSGQREIKPSPLTSAVPTVPPSEPNEVVLTSRPAAKFIGMKVVTVEASKEPTESKMPSSPTARAVSGSAPSVGRAETIIPTAHTPTEISASDITALVSSVPVADINKSLQVQPRAASKKVDMSAIAKQAQERADAEAAVAAAEEEAAKAEARAALKPGKGGLKRTYAEANNGAPVTDEQAARKAKVRRGIRWRDREGDKLCDIREIEPREGITRNTGKYKEMQQREKQMEKDARKIKTTDSMQKTCEWVSPTLLKLSLEVQEASLGPVNSNEKPVIESYVAITSDASYPDVSLIPNDPMEPSASADSGILAVVPPKKVVSIVFQSGPVGGFNAAGHTANEDMFDPLGAVDNNSLLRPNTNAPNLLYASVPIELHFLEPALLQVLARDPHQIASLLNFDGSVNHTMVQTFRQLVGGVTALPPPVVANRESRFSNISSGSAPSMQPHMTVNPFTSEVSILPPPPTPQTMPASKGALKNRQASIPCTWFNTPQGCLKGDACVYGHFRKIK